MFRRMWAEGVRRFGGEPAVAATVLKVEGMRCEGCVQALTRVLEALPEVRTVAVDLAAGTARITPRSADGPSPHALWDAIEKAGFEPRELAGPAGVFSARPV